MFWVLGISNLIILNDIHYIQGNSFIVNAIGILPFAACD